MCARTAGMVALLERDSELRLLERVIESAQRGRGGVVLIEGRAGVGKTELLRLAGSSARTPASGFSAGAAQNSIVRSGSASSGRCSNVCAGVAGRAGRWCGVRRGGFHRFAHGSRRRRRAVRAPAWPVLARRKSRCPATAAAPCRRPPLDRYGVVALAGYLAERDEDLPLVLDCATRPAEPGADQALIDVLTDAAQVVRPAPLSAEAAGVLVRRHLPDAVDGSPMLVTRRVAGTRSCSASCWRNWSTRGWSAPPERRPRSSSSAPNGWTHSATTAAAVAGRCDHSRAGRRRARTADANAGHRRADRADAERGGRRETRSFRSTCSPPIVTSSLTSSIRWSAERYTARRRRWNGNGCTRGRPR